MMSLGRVHALGLRVTLPERLLRKSRYVKVEVLDEGRVADDFQVSRAATLREAMAPVYRHLPAEGVAVRLVGIEDSWWPFGIHCEQRRVLLCCLPEAVSFLEGTS
jgi:hypothetical protein